MDYSILGRTNLEVSRISLGTAELGLNYGIRESGKTNLIAKEDAIDILKYALNKGINLFDTAPGYGRSEELLGEVIGNRRDCVIATKVPIPFKENRLLAKHDLQQKLNTSIDNSLRNLRRQVLDIAQIHNATVEVMKHGGMVEALLGNRQAGKIRFLGVSVYGEENASFAIQMGCFDVIQVAYSLLDQRMSKYVFPEAKEREVGVINRSVLLKGALSSRAQWLPDELLLLRRASEKILEIFGVSWDALPQLACRFCLSSEFLHTVLIGASNKQEIESAISASLEGPLDQERLKIAKGLGLDDEKLLNPYYWPIL